jgi:hypothetical protein
VNTTGIEPPTPKPGGLLGRYKDSFKDTEVLTKKKATTLGCATIQISIHLGSAEITLRSQQPKLTAEKAEQYQGPTSRSERCSEQSYCDDYIWSKGLCFWMIFRVYLFDSLDVWVHQREHQK